MVNRSPQKSELLRWLLREWEQKIYSKETMHNTEV